MPGFLKVFGYYDEAKATWAISVSLTFGWYLFDGPTN